jgi:putative ABC transport system substrate-binding protein
MKRRDFITLLGGTAAWPLAARAQQGDRVRRIGVLTSGENDPVATTWVSAFTQALAGLGWTDGRNVRMDLRWYSDDINRSRALAQELVGLQPDIILALGTVATVAVQQETRTIPIVFANAVDPIASGIVPRLNQPGGNITGFARFETTLGGKWLELLSEIAPGLKRVAIMFNLNLNASAYMPSFETAARSLKIEPIAAPVRSDVEIEAAIGVIGRESRRIATATPCRRSPLAHSSPIIRTSATSAIQTTATHTENQNQLNASSPALPPSPR